MGGLGFGRLVGATKSIGYRWEAEGWTVASCLGLGVGLCVLLFSYGGLMVALGPWAVRH